MDKDKKLSEKGPKKKAVKRPKATADTVKPPTVSDEPPPIPTPADGTPAAPVQFVNIKELGDFVARGPRQIHRLHALGHPLPNESGLYNLAQCLAWWETYKAGRTKGDVKLKKRAELEALKTKLQCERMRFELDVRRGAYTPNSKIREDISRLVSQTVDLLRRRFCFELPREYVGQDAAENKVTNETALNECLRKMNGFGATIPKID